MKVLALLALSANLAFADEIPLRKQSGLPPQGWTNPSLQPGKSFVRDCHGISVGWVAADGTYDMGGHRLLEYPSPEHLLAKSGCVRR